MTDEERRDMFAAHALMGMLGSENTGNLIIESMNAGRPIEATEHTLARVCFTLADAMMEARKKGPDDD